MQRALLFCSSFFLAVAAALVILSWRAAHFAPSVVDADRFIQNYRHYLAPENDLSLYIVSVFVVLVGTVVGWSLLHLLLRRNSGHSRFLRAAWMVRVSILCCLTVIVGLVVFPQRNIPLFSIISFFSASVLLSLPVKSGWIRHFDIVAGLSLFGLLTGTVMLLGFAPAFVRAFLIAQFQSYFYVYAETYSPIGWAAIYIFLLGVAIFWYKTPQRLKSMGRVHPISILLDVSAVIFTVMFVSIVIPWWQGKYGGYYSYPPVIAPINDVMGGKTILVDAHSQYGVLFIYALRGIFYFLPFTLDVFYWVNYATMIIAYLLLYTAMRLWFRNIAGAWFGLFLLSQHHYFSQHHNMLFFSQSTFLRFGWWVILLVFLLIKETWEKTKEARSQKQKVRVKIQKHAFHVIELLFLGIGVFWGFDVGVYTLAAYLAYRGVNDWLSAETVAGKIKNIIISWVHIATVIGIFFVGLSIFTRFRAGIWPDWHQYAAAAFEFSGGFHLTPMPHFGMHYVLAFVYIAVLVFVLYQLLSDTVEKEENLSILAFVSTYGSLQFFYYAGESTNGVLHLVIVPFLILISWFAVRSRRCVSQIAGFPFYQQSVFLLLALNVLAWFSIVTYAGLLNTYGTIVRRGPLSPGIDMTVSDSPYWQSVAAVKSYLGNSQAPNRRVAIVSAYDWIYHLHTKSVDVMDVNNIIDYNRVDQMHALGHQLLERNAPVVFVDHEAQYPGWEIVLSYVKQKYRFQRNIGDLDIWEKIE